MSVREKQIEWPDLRRYSDIPIFNTKAVVQQTGVPAPTLRAWERRYTLLSPERANNDYRLYSEQDIAMIRWLKKRLDSGMSISQAIALFRHMSEEQQQLEQVQTYSIENNTPTFHISLPNSHLKQEQIQAEDVHGAARENAPQLAIEDWPHVGSERVLTSYAVVHNMCIMQKHLVEACELFDEITASMLMASMLAIYPVERVCTELITPTMWQIGQLWEEGKITVSVEHFAALFFRGLLSNLLHVAPGPATGPLAIACCAPGEAHELAPLMLSLCLRRAGMRVAFLGQSIEAAGLLQTIKQLAPALICVSLTMPAYLASLIDLGSKIQAMAAPRPIFVFGGQVFSSYGHLVSQVPGVYVNGDMKSIIMQLSRMIAERIESRN